MKLSANNVNRFCEVLDNSGNIIATGKIVAVNNNHIKITSNKNEMSIIKNESLVKLRIHISDGKDILIETYDARVNQSDASALFLTDVLLVTDKEKRSYYRVSVTLDTKAYPYTNKKTLDESKSFKVKIRDLSIRGCFILTDANINEGDKLNLVLPLGEAEIYECSVMRKCTNDNRIGYGCSFCKFSSKQEDLLCGFIFEEQRKMISKAKMIE